MRKLLLVGLAFASPMILSGDKAAACSNSYGYSSYYGYSSPRAYGYTAPRYYGYAYSGPRLRYYNARAVGWRAGWGRDRWRRW